MLILLKYKKKEKKKKGKHRISKLLKIAIF